MTWFRNKAASTLLEVAVKPYKCLNFNIIATFVNAFICPQWSNLCEHTKYTDICSNELRLGIYSLYSVDFKDQICYSDISCRRLGQTLVGFISVNNEN